MEAAARVLGGPREDHRGQPHRRRRARAPPGRAASPSPPRSRPPALAPRAQRPAAAARCACSTRARRPRASTRGARPAASATLYLIDRGPQRRSVPAPLRLARAASRSTTDAMRQGSRALRGKHDFTAFCAAAGRDRTPTCTVTLGAGGGPARAPRRSASPPTASCITWSATSWGAWSRSGGAPGRPGGSAEVLDGRDRKRAGPTAPAQGLVLVRVLYGPEARPRAAAAHDAARSP